MTGGIRVNKPNISGKLHVTNVGVALKQYLIDKSIESFTEPVQETVKFIVEMYPNIQNVTTKYDTTQPDFNPDILLTLQNKQEIKMNLFYIKGSAKIQAKNLGAKSFLQKYFDSKVLQAKFNDYVGHEYDTYLKSIIETKEPINVYDKTKQLKNKVGNYYPKFVDEINPFRKSFLFSLREYCFRLLKEEFNEGKPGILHAFKEFLLMDSINIITRHNGKNECLYIEHWNTVIDETKDIHLYKKGITTVGIRMGNEAVTIRFKLESNPISSIKLATSYDHFPTEDKLVRTNLKTIQNFEKLIAQHQNTEKGNISNAVGKCNEAMTYYRLLKSTPSINQVDAQEYHSMLAKYSPVVPNKTLLDIQKSSESAEETLKEYLQEKYQNYEIESIQLIPDSYLKDYEDTRDLLLILRVNKQYVEEGFSLKAIAKRKVKITVKNPGAGQILGPQYFDTDSLALVIDETKEAFHQNQINHTQSLEKVSSAIGQSLQNATQEKLKKGITSLLGHAPTVVTVYTINKSKIIKHGAVKGGILVHPETPTAIQTTLCWNENEEELSLRVKFSGGQSKGWSSLKLACEYQVEV